METEHTSSLASVGQRTAATTPEVVLRLTAHDTAGAMHFLLQSGGRETYTEWVWVDAVPDVFRAANGVMRHWKMPELEIADYRVAVSVDGSCEVLAWARQGVQLIEAGATAVRAGMAAMDVWLQLYNRTFFGESA